MNYISERQRRENELLNEVDDNMKGARDATNALRKTISVLLKRVDRLERAAKTTDSFLSEARRKIEILEQANFDGRLEWLEQRR